MKKYRIASIFVLVVLITVCFSIYNQYKVNKVQKFDVSFYIDCIEYHENHPSDSFPGFLGPITDAKTLRAVADDLWLEIYGEEIMSDEKPYLVEFDDTNGVWHISGSMPFSIRCDIFGVTRYGGVAHLIVQKSDGKVLALWHDK